jgi:cytochrome b6
MQAAREDFEGKMADENNPNGSNGKGRIADRESHDRRQRGYSALKTDIPTKAKEQIEGLKDPTKTQVYTSIFRHKHDDTPRNRALGVLSNVFLHLHPAKINRDAVRYSYTWGMGGITFYLYITLTFTGVLLMFYYHPSKVQAFRDVLYLEHDVPFGKILRNMHRWAAHSDGDHGVAAHVPRVPHRVVQETARVQLGGRRAAAGVHAAAQLHRISAARRSTGFWAVTVGTNMARATPLLGHEGPFGSMLGMTPYNDVRFGLLGGSIVDANALLRSYIWHCIGIPIVASSLHDRALLARAQRRRHFGAGAGDA